MLSSKFLSHLQNELTQIENDGLYKRERIITSSQDAKIVANGKKLLNFCANNYLGLSNHPEVIKGACSIASAIYLARQNKTKEEIKKYIEDRFKYSFEPISEIRKWHTFDETCQVTVPIAIQAFLEGKDFEDVLINAIYAGGDTDTIACMACSIAEAYYEIPNKFLNFCYSKIALDLKIALKNFLIFVKEENRLNNNLEKVLNLLKNENI